MPETPFSSAGEKLLASGAMPAIPQTNVERREGSFPSHAAAFTGGPTSNARSQRVFLRMQLTPELDELLAEMAKIEGGYPEMMREALGLLKIAQEARAQGKRLLVVDDRENSEQEITL